ncbi:MAG: helicase-related protein, partial [Christensenellaceae bacterium]
MVGEVTIYAATDCFLSEGDADEIERALDFGLKKCKDSKAYARMNAIAEELRGKICAGLGSPYCLPLIRNACPVFELFDPSSVLVFDECKQIDDKINSLWKEHAERFTTLLQGGEVFPFSVDQLISRETFLDGISHFRQIAVQNFAMNLGFFRAFKSYDLKATPMGKYLGEFDSLFTDLASWRRNGYRIVIFSGTAERVGKMKEYLFDRGLSYEDAPSFDELRTITVSEEFLSHGIVLHESKLVLIGTDDLYTKSAREKRVRRRRGDLFIAPEIGDYAVHEQYGIGKITGTKMIETLESTKEYIAISYRDGDMVYVPVEQMDSLSKYMGADQPQLSKIGTGEFERVKTRLKNSLKKMAFDLKQLYAERSAKKGYAFPYYVEPMEEFESFFPYTPTADQESSFEEIKADMCSTKVMDRLLCGDVGFGKTEVAFRAIYLCVLGGKQAALLCPSTVLSDQHYRNALERFQEFGVRVECLNRFRTPKQQERILTDLKAGKVDLLIGTHRILSKDVEFSDLGLLVLDEEQRFGVEHKERIKTLKKDVDCLTMTATPIPRTLHMSLTGIRDISTIQTPPSARLPVQTYVVEETEPLLRDACIREIARGGQVFVLYNRVESIYTFAQRLAQIVPEGKIVIGHGQMAKEQLENNIMSFYEGESNILVTTTIIENGIDLPNANCLIVIDSDRLGIAQLYQLRGRVGRGTRLAHAYFTFKADKVMTEEAVERLRAIMEFTELGSGYKIAVRDLEIRGAGNVLGAEQHGHMDKVGYELYSKLLKEQI